MSALATITPKLVKLLPLLASDQPGEVVATAAAISRTLKAAGADWHDLVSNLTDTPGKKLPAWGEPSTWVEAVRVCAMNPDLIQERDFGFLRSVASFHDPSEKQLAWIAAIYDRVRQAHGLPALGLSARPCWWPSTA